MMVGPETLDFVGHPSGPCPGDEEIAAFIDGKLAGAERERLVAHLADCRPCYEVFVGAMRFEEEVAGAGEGGRVVPFPLDRREEKETREGRRRGRPKAPWWQVAAAAVLVLGIGYGGYRTLFSRPSITVAGVTDPLLSRAEAAQQLYQLSRVRGGPGRPPAGLDAECPSFMIGVLLVDLRLAPRAKAADLLAEIGDEVGRAPYGNDLAGRYQRDAERAKASAAFVDQLAADLPRREAELDGSRLDRDMLAFGKWSEACRLAAVSGAPETFADRNNRRFLDWEEKQLAARRRTLSSSGGLDLKAERASATLKTLRSIEANWRPGNPPPRYAALAQQFGELIGRYDL